MDKGVEALMADCVELYEQWPVRTPPTDVYRSGLQTCDDCSGLRNEHLRTWPLPFEGDPSITALMDQCGWDQEEIEAFRTHLFSVCSVERQDCRQECTEDCVIWLDVQKAFRSVIDTEIWNNYEDASTADMLSGR